MNYMTKKLIKSEYVLDTIKRRCEFVNLSGDDIDMIYEHVLNLNFDVYPRRFTTAWFE